MGKEPTDIRLTRIEDGLVGLRGELAQYQTQVQKALDKLENHSESITILKRDRFWISGIVGLLSSLVGAKLSGK